MISCDCSVDVEYDEIINILNESFPKARKEHGCCECGGKIKPKEKYHYVAGVHNGDFETFKTCMPCYRIRMEYCAAGFFFGGLQETIYECLGFNYLEKGGKK